jgi:hypothetical protein
MAQIPSPSKNALMNNAFTLLNGDGYEHQIIQTSRNNQQDAIL